MKLECDHLDNYLADDLPADAATRFSQHLDHCEACREAVDEQRWINGLLRSDLRASLEPTPTALRETLYTTIARRRQNARLIACGLATAVTVAIVALGWTLHLNRQADGPPAQEFAQAAAAPPRATFAGGPDFIVVPIESKSPNVTVVRVYPTYRSTFALGTSDDVDVPETDFLQPDDFNGG